MEKHYGGCHCGQVRFEMESDVGQAVNCNCSICTKKGAWHARVAPEQFKVTQGKSI